MTSTPNLFAFAALLAWPLVAVWLYRTYPIGRATIWTILGGFLLLPVGTEFKFEMIPAFDKGSIPNLAALLGCILVARRLPRLGYGLGLAEVLILMLLVGPFITSSLNTDDISAGRFVFSGVGYYDALSAVASQFLAFIPFILARQFLREASDTTDILRALTIAGLAYSLPILFEFRMSPQLHTWTYGYFPSAWIQQVRDGGFRPVVFIGHGLGLAFFFTTTVVASAALWRMRTRITRFPPVGLTAYLGGVLVLCKSLGPVIYSAVLVPLIRWATLRTQLRLAVVLVCISLAYPTLRTIDLVPTSFLLDTAESISEERAKSLQTRFQNEQVLLDHASKRVWFGWGRFGRNRAIDPDSVDFRIITDGYWVILVGVFGLVGFVSVFGLLALSVFRARSALRFADPNSDGIALAALALIVAVNMIDLLPNASLTPWTWLMAGALLGRAEALRSAARRRAPQWDSKTGLAANRMPP